MKKEVDLLMDLRGLRKEADISMAKVAWLSGIADSNISRMEIGEAPSLVNALKYARFLHLSVEEIWGIKETTDGGK